MVAHHRGMGRRLIGISRLLHHLPHCKSKLVWYKDVLLLPRICPASAEVRNIKSVRLINQRPAAASRHAPAAEHACLKPLEPGVATHSAAGFLSL